VAAAQEALDEARREVHAVKEDARAGIDRAERVLRRSRRIVGGIEGVMKG